MARAQNARVYSPPEPPPRAYAPPQDAGGGGRTWMILAIMVIVLATSGFVLWSMFGGGATSEDAPVIEADGDGFKQRYNGPPVDELATSEIDRALAGNAAMPKSPPKAVVAPEEPLPDVATPPRAPAKVAVAKAPVAAAAGGGFVVQVASLRSEGAADAAWDRLAARDPALFAGARKDVQRADLGEKGVYFRVRAGYFAERAEAGRFCDRVKTLGQDCLVVVR